MKTYFYPSENREHDLSFSTENDDYALNLCIDGDIGELELVDIIDKEAVQSLMDDFYRLTSIPVGIVDLKDNILVATGWQDICTKFHRVNPETCRNCIESDLELTQGVAPGTYKSYKCKNNMWDMVTPIVVGGSHLGNLFLGQFFFDDEEISEDDFRLQAKKYGFDEKEYLEALDRVPRWSQETVDMVMSFYTRLTDVISSLSYSNIKLAKALKERDDLLTSLHESESRFRSYVGQAPDCIYVADEKGNYIDVNEMVSKVTGYSREELLGMNLIDIIAPEDIEKASLHFKETVETGSAVADVHFMTKNGEKRIGTIKAIKLNEKTFLGFATDITERKLMEDEREITIRLLDLLNKSIDLHGLVDSVTELLQEWSDCEAVGIRLKKDDDYPYYQTRGFPESFVIQENSLCSIDSNGKVLRDEIENPVLECLCGNVIVGRFDSERPFFTSHGSFWTNSVSEFLVDISESEREELKLNRCNCEGYESIALIPLRSHGKTLGLIQFNDPRKGMFTVGIIALLEHLADSIAMALAQQQAQKTVIEHEEKLQSIFRAAPAGIGLLINRVIIHVNTRMCEMIGYSIDELIGSNARMLYPTQEDFDYVGKEKYRQIAEKGTGTVETRWKRKDGAIIDVLLSSTPIDVSDLSKGVTFTALDITERKRAEEEMEKYKQIVSSTQDGISLVDADYRYSIVNNAYETYSGKKREEFIGLTVPEYLGTDLFNSEIKDNFDRCLGGENVRYQTWVQYPTLGKRFVDVTYVPYIDKKNEIAGIVANTRDITSLKEAEEALGESQQKLSLAMEASEYGFWDLDLDSGIMFMSPSMYIMNGYEPGELPAKLEAMMDLVHPDDRELILKALKDSTKQKKPFHLEFRIRHRCGEWIWVSVKGKPVNIDEKGIPHRLIGTQVNITSWVKAEEALIYAKAAADESNRMKSEMLKNVTHELRTPLTAVIGFSDLLLTENVERLDDTQREYVNHIHEGGKNLLSIVNRIIDFASTERGNMESVELQSIYVKDLVSNTLNLLSAKALGKNIVISTLIDQELKDVVADKEKLEEILFNLVENAIKFTSSGGSVEIEAKKINGVAIFTVKDTGIGIAKEKLDSIFEPFKQIDGSISRKYGGTGLGLALVKKLVVMHGGNIQVESEPGNGSTFKFEIPIKSKLESGCLCSDCTG